MRESVIKRIDEEKIIVISRGLYGEKLIELSEALYRGGIRLIEITFDQSAKDPISETKNAIKSLVEHFGDSMLIGAGTVLNVEQVNAAYEACAKYIISPNTNDAVVKRTLELGLVSIPAALTPSEVMHAHDMGADFIKMFPVGTLGVKYAKDLMAPISHVKYLATAGMTEETFKSFLDIGYAGAGISGRLTEKSLIENNEFDELERRAAAFVAIAKSCN